MRFLVVDDDWLTRGGVVKAIESIQADAAVAEASSLHDAYVCLQENPTTDLVILDLNLRESQGIDTLVEFRSWCESQQIEPRTVVLSGDDNPTLVTEVLANHGTGFIVKGTKPKVFEHALAMTVDGGVFVPEEILRAIAPKSTEQRATDSTVEPTPRNFTPRETEIAALLVRGLTYKKIARALEQRHNKVISENTVRTHVGNLAWKLGVTTNAKAGVMAEIAKRGLKFALD